MYANELAFENTDAAVSMLEVRKREPEDDAIATMRVDNRSVEWTRDGAEVVLRHAANKGATMVISVLFRPVQWLEHVPSVKYRLTVAARRVLSELRDESLRWRPRVV
jgi:Holliday junction resolvase-like predicted endonuclease